MIKKVSYVGNVAKREDLGEVTILPFNPQFQYVGRTEVINGKSYLCPKIYVVDANGVLKALGPELHICPLSEDLTSQGVLYFVQRFLKENGNKKFKVTKVTEHVVKRVEYLRYDLSET